MHFHFDMSAANILWILTFAGELVLLVVLLGRDRARRFRWFTLYISLMALLLLVNKLLFGRMATDTASVIFLALTDCTVIAGLLVIAELAKQAFAEAPRRPRLLGSILVAAVALAVLALWGPWPAWQTLTGGSALAALRAMELFADKGTTLIAVLAIQATVAVLFFGRRLHAGWRSHVQQILIGLSMAAISQLAVRAIWQVIATHTVVHSMEQYQRVMGLRGRMYDANDAIFLCALVWWIGWLWADEPGNAAPAALQQPGGTESAAGDSL